MEGAVASAGAWRTKPWPWRHGMRPRATGRQSGPKTRTAVDIGRYAGIFVDNNNHNDSQYDNNNDNNKIIMIIRIIIIVIMIIVIMIIIMIMIIYVYIHIICMMTTIWIPTMLMMMEN